MTEMNTAPSGAFAALRIPDFRSFVFARFCISLALQIQGTIVGWQVYKITHSKLSIGFIGLAEVVPAVVVSLYAGHIADIIERKKIILTTILLLLICSASLLSFTLGASNLLLTFGVIPIYVVIFFSGLARGFLSPANFAFMPQLVPRNLYANAISLNSTFWQTTAIAGPILSILLYTSFDFGGAYIADVALTVLSLIIYFVIPTRPIPPATEHEQGTAEKIKTGLRFVFKNQIVLNAISLDLFAVLFGGATALLPAFAEDVFKSPEALGLLRSATPIGAALMALYISRYPIKKHIGIKLLLCVAGFGLCMIGFGLSTNLYLSIAILALSGAFDSVSVIVRSTLIHTLTPENMKGRVSAVNSMFIGSSNELGAFESGVAAWAFGLVRSVVLGGCVTLGVVAFTGWRAKKLVALDKVS